MEPKDVALGHSLDDMRELSWEQTLTQDQTFLQIVNPSAKLLETLSERFSLDELHIKDILNRAHPSQFTRLKNGALHIILRFPFERVGEVKAHEVTSASILSDKKMCALIWPGERYHTVSNVDLIGLNAEECVCKIIHLLVENLLRRVYALREDMDELEDECLTDVGNADMGKLLLMRKEFSILARHASSNAITIEKLRAEPRYRDSLRLIDAHEHMLRASSIAESRTEHALSVMQAIQSLLSQRLNQVLTFLALITVILTPMGVIAGVFGMNFTNMDVLKTPNGFVWVISVMLLLATALAIIFKIKKWW